MKCLEFVNADLIAGGLSPFAPERAVIHAGWPAKCAGGHTIWDDIYPVRKVTVSLQRGAILNSPAGPAQVWVVTTEISNRVNLSGKHHFGLLPFFSQIFLRLPNNLLNSFKTGQIALDRS